MIGLSTLVLLALFRFATIRSFRITSMTTILYTQRMILIILKKWIFSETSRCNVATHCSSAKKTYRNHSYFNRIGSLYEGLGIMNVVRVGDGVWKPFRVPSNSLPAISPIHHAQYFIETGFLAMGRYVKRNLLEY